MEMVSPNDMKFSGKRHLLGFDDSRFLQGLQPPANVSYLLFGPSACF